MSHFALLEHDRRSGRLGQRLLQQTPKQLSPGRSLHPHGRTQAASSPLALPGQWKGARVNQARRTLHARHTHWNSASAYVKQTDQQQLLKRGQLFYHSERLRSKGHIEATVRVKIYKSDNVGR